MAHFDGVSNLSPRQKQIIVLAAGSLLRLFLFFGSPLPGVLERRPELSTPITSLRSLNEGVYIYERGTDPYQGGVLYHSPLYLAFFTYVIPISSRALTILLWTMADLISALALSQIWQTRRTRSGEKVDRLDKEAMITSLFMFNPYNLATCLARSTTSLDNALVLSSISLASSNYPTMSLFLLALVSHTALYPILILPPMIMLIRETRLKRSLQSSTPISSSTWRLIGTFVSFALGLVGVNWTILGWNWVSRTWGVILTVSDLTPNVGMWWYFFTEMFDHFRIFFLGVFQLHTVIYVTPICLRLGKDPQFAILCLLGIIGTWKSYPTLGDTSLWVGLLACFPEVVSNLRHPLFSLTVSLYTSILLPLLHSSWLLTGTGNANFFYAATMVHGLNLGLAVADILTAGIKAEIQRKVGLGDIAMKGGLAGASGDGVPIASPEVENPGTVLVDNLLDDDKDGDSLISWDRELIQRIWKSRQWEVVQLSGPDD